MEQYEVEVQQCPRTLKTPRLSSRAVVFRGESGKGAIGEDSEKTLSIVAGCEPEMAPPTGRFGEDET